MARAMGSTSPSGLELSMAVPGLSSSSGSGVENLLGVCAGERRRGGVPDGQRGGEEFPMGSVEEDEEERGRRRRRAAPPQEAPALQGAVPPPGGELPPQPHPHAEPQFKLAGTRSAAAWARATGRGLGRERPLRRCPDEPRRQPELRPRRRRGRFLPVLAGGGGGGAAAGGAAWPHVGDEAAELTDGSHVNRGLSC
ncbi:hypothetical protein PVAP13_3NG304518 [Panicum virgatum]|uniref:Uncharacterized protein n=1 Tax=Panicum virgatum TaxID=38727 RepID=A0A8T0UCJ4_PANVG|nr:hypothetical protein PVAP13_3NG304518 [Panicum virgatum]